MPISLVISGPNANDSTMLEAVVDDIPLIRMPTGRRRRRPRSLHADKGYDYPRSRAALRRRGIRPRIARRGVESSQRLGRWRWRIERTIAWLLGFRRLRIRYERCDEHFFAFAMLARSLICFQHPPPATLVAVRECPPSFSLAGKSHVTLILSVMTGPLNIDLTPELSLLVRAEPGEAPSCDSDRMRLLLTPSHRPGAGPLARTPQVGEEWLSSDENGHGSSPGAPIRCRTHTFRGAIDGSHAPYC